MSVRDPRGNIIPEHEEYLEARATIRALRKRYEDPIEDARRYYTHRAPGFEHSTGEAWIRVTGFEFWHLYDERAESFKIRQMQTFPIVSEEEVLLPVGDIGIDKRVLIDCSTHARDYFELFPESNEVEVPVKDHREHDRIGHQYNKDYIYDHPAAPIHREPIENQIIPWMNEVAKLPKYQDGVSKAGPSNGEASPVPSLTIPDGLDDKIKLYNAAIQLGLPKFIIRPLTQALVLQMHQTRLENINLELIETTLGRLNGRAVDILDPVINHFVGTYALRCPEDRLALKMRGHDGIRYIMKSLLNPHDPNEQIICPPRLQVLGHSIRHWSGIREIEDLNQDDDFRAATMGYPLNLGNVHYYWRKREDKTARQD